LVGGVDGGLSLWHVAMGKLERAAAESRELEQRFRSYPPAALNQLLVDVDDALRTAALAVELQLALDGEDDNAGPDARRESIAALLLERARGLVDDRGR